MLDRLQKSKSQADTKISRVFGQQFLSSGFFETSLYIFRAYFRKSGYTCCMNKNGHFLVNFGQHANLKFFRV